MEHLKFNAKDLVEMLLEDDIEDMALDFIEGAIGRYTFPKSWEKLKPEVKKAMAEGWLRGVGNVVVQPLEIVEFVDKIAHDGYVWRR
jgi:hypothetical protein